MRERARGGACEGCLGAIGEGIVRERVLWLKTAVERSFGARNVACYAIRMRQQLSRLGNDELLASLRDVVRRGNEITAELIEHLVELEERMLHVELGFPSLWAYCVGALGLCEATAGRRIAVARVCRKFPQALELIASGALHVSALCLMKAHLNSENAAELFELCSHRSAREVEVALAVRFPKPDVRESIRRLPDAPTLNVESQQMGAVRAKSGGRVEPLAADRFGVHFTVDTEFCELLERVRALASHRLPNGDLKTLLQRGLQSYERELEKERFGVAAKARAPKCEAAKARAPRCEAAKARAPKAQTAKAGARGGSARGAQGDGPATDSNSQTVSTVTEKSVRLRTRGSRRTRYYPRAVAREVYARRRAMHFCL